MAQFQESRIGVLGGCFDPVHNGHCAIAQLAYEYFSLDRILFIPANIPPHKKNSISAETHHRRAMLECAIRNNDAFQIWDGEIVRGGVSFTSDTIGALREAFAGAALYFIIGSDNIPDILSWRNYKTILDAVTLCVAHRPGHSLRIPAALKDARIKFFPSPEWGVSSTLVKSYCSRNLSCKYLLPAEVVTYIQKNGLYTGK